MSDSGNLLHNLLLFGRLLRRLGLDVNPGRMIDLASALGHIEVGRRSDVYHAMRSLLVHRCEDFAAFDAAFEAFWRKPREGRTTVELRAFGEHGRVRRPGLAPPSLAEAPATLVADGPEAASGEEPSTPAPTLTYSAREALRHKDFAELTGPEMDEVRRAIAAMVWSPGERRTRRQRPGAGPRVDMRRTLRRSLRHGGEVLRWERREPRSRPRKLVVLADISGSMERYTRLLLLFVHALAAGLDQGVEAFVFGTRLTRITRPIRRRDVDAALTEVARAVPDWSGGTRIGDSLREFNFRWARRVLRSGSVVLLISDGWDCGDPDLLRREVARLQRSCHRLIWLNPLLGSPEYEPLTRGMAAALPHADDFLPVHSLASLEQLAEKLGSVGPARPRRAQRPARGPRALRSLHA
jgi:hypothetical protein